MSLDKTEDRQHRIRVFGRTRQFAAALWDGPKTHAELAEYFHAYLRFLGLFNFRERLGYLHDWLGGQVEETLEQLIERGWVVRQGETYALTSLGREETGKAVAEMQRTFVRVGKLLQPQTVSKVSLGVHFGLAVLKLPAALLSGSVGLLNDAADTLLDGVSSLLVYIGLRFGKERAVDIVLVLLMLGTGGLTLYEAGQRFFVPLEPETNWFSFLAAVLSAVVCTLLYFCQRFIGSRSGSVALITQSVDSRNHVIVAISVTAGLVASVLRFNLLDTLVGLAVALLILKSAVELAVETVRSLGEEKPDLSHYKFKFVERYEQFWQEQLRDWMLYLVKNRQACTRAELIEQARQVLDFAGNPMLQGLGLVQHPQAEEVIGRCVAELFERGWLVDDGRLRVTDEAWRHLSQQRMRSKREYGWQQPHRRFRSSEYGEISAKPGSREREGDGLETSVHLSEGYVQVYTGDGKGKTTAALGLALRAAGHGIRTYVGQFMKGQPYGELDALRDNPCITVEQYGDANCIRREEVTPEHVAQAQRGLERAREAMHSGRYDIILLDEVNVAIYFGLLAVSEVLAFLDQKPAHTEVVLTGRRAPPELIERADLVTEMREVKHYYRQGITARKGIER